MTIQDRLFELQDISYRDFQAPLVPTRPKETFIGVRMPAMRKLAKDLLKEPESKQFIAVLPHHYYEEDILHGLLISESKDYDSTIAELDRFLPYVDNWATCDLLSPRLFKSKKHHPALEKDIRRWLDDDRPYIKRFAIEMLMSHFLEDDFQEKHLKWVSAERMDHYYVKMMVAWYLATALAKQWDATIKILQSPVLEKWTHNKTIQKSIESYRITPEQKDYLRTLRR